MKAVIVAGGKGERIRPVSRTIPKPLLEIGGRPLVEHQLLLLRRYGIGEIHLTLRARDLDAFRGRFGAGERLGVALHYHVEDKPLGTSGGLVPILGQLGDDFVVLYGDVMAHLDLNALVEFHRAKQAAATLVVHPTDHPLDSDLVALDEHGRLVAFHRKPHPRKAALRNLGNAAAYVLSQRLAALIPPGAGDFVRDVFPRALQAGLPLFGYRTREYLKDIGTPERLAAVRRDWDSGRLELRHRDHALPAVFFDRDGTICEHVPFLYRVEDFQLLPGAAAAVRRVNDAGRLAVVITNQPVIARGLCTLAELDRIHARMETLLGEHGARLDGIYFCPHHPDAGFPGEHAELKIRCECRKPRGGLLRRAACELNIDLARSAIIGDSTRDIETGKRLGLRTVLVQTGNAGRDGKYPAQPDAICRDLSEAVDSLL